MNVLKDANKTCFGNIKGRRKLQGEGFMEKVTFKLNLKGRVDFLRQITCMPILAKNFFRSHFIEYFALHLFFLHNTYLLS